MAVIILPNQALSGAASQVLFQNIFDQVSAITRRADLVPETERAIAAATARFHNANDWARDLARALSVPVDITLAQDTLASLGYIDYVVPTIGNANLPQYRKTQTVAHSATVAAPQGAAALFAGGAVAIAGQELEHVSVLDLQNPLIGRRVNCWYTLGGNVIVRSQVSAPVLDLTYYTSPLTSRGAYNSWIAVLADYAIVDEAVSRVLHTIGLVAEGNAYAARFRPNLLDIMRATEN